MVRPWADEREDYVEYKRLRDQWRNETPKRPARQLRKPAQSSDVTDEHPSVQTSDHLVSGEHSKAQKKHQIVESKSAKVLGQPDLSKQFNTKAPISNSKASDPTSVTSKPSKTASKEKSNANAAKDGAVDEKTQRARRAYDGSYDQKTTTASSAPKEARGSPGPARPTNAAVDVGRQFSSMSLNQMQCMNAALSEHVFPRRASPETLAARQISPKTSYSNLLDRT